MLTAVIIGIPLFLILAGTLGALALSVGPVEEKAPAHPATQPRPEIEYVSELPAFHLPVERPARPVPVADLISRIETHLRTEREAAARFANDPSSRSLWLN